MADKKVRNNPNGNCTELEWVQMIHRGEIGQWMRKHKLTTDKCPPMKLIASDTQCTYCVTCQQHCIDQVKAYKNHYSIGKVKYLKEDLDKE